MPANVLTVSALSDCIAVPTTSHEFVLKFQNKNVSPKPTVFADDSIVTSSVDGESFGNVPKKSSVIGASVGLSTMPGL